MKKIILSVFTILTLGAYAFYSNKTASAVHRPEESLTPKPTPSLISAPTPTPSTAKGAFKNGTYTGSVVDVYYGYVQIEAVISRGALTDINFLRYPDDRQTSRSISSQALPWLKEEAIQAQSADVDTISGATQTSGGFRESLAAALYSAKN